jgi:hypothetical protein
VLKFKSVGPISVRSALVAFLLGLAATVPFHAQQGVGVPIVQQIDAAVNAREQGLLAYTVTEHYTVFRGHDQEHPAAEMLVKTTYRKDVGKTFSILSEAGPELLRKALEMVLENEQRITQPANRAGAVITSQNYEMTVKGIEPVTARNDGQDCVAVSLKPRRESPYLFNGTIWVDAQNASIVQLHGFTARSPSIFSGVSEVFRQYAMIEGFPMATQAKAISNSWLLGQTVIKIDYLNYQLEHQAGSGQTRAGNAPADPGSHDK